MNYTSKYKKRKKLVNGGASMYQPNIIQPGLNPGGTANLVYNESDPALQEQRKEKLDSEITNLQEKTDNFSSAYKNQQLLNKQALSTQESEFKAKTSTAENLVGQTTEKASDLLAERMKKNVAEGIISKGTSRAFQRGTKALEAGKTKKAARLMKRAARRGGNAPLDAAKKSTGLLSTGSLMSIGGQVISGLSNDNDATKWNAGEVTGDIMSSAGTGAMLGSVIPGVGNLIGGFFGGLYGLGKGLLGRRKARRLKAKQDSEQAASIKKHNTDLNEALAPQLAMARAGEVQQKTTSGYDMGTNISAKYGGMKKYI